MSEAVFNAKCCSKRMKINKKMPRSSSKWTIPPFPTVKDYFCVNLLCPKANIERVRLIDFVFTLIFDASSKQKNNHSKSHWTGCDQYVQRYILLLRDIYAVSQCQLTCHVSLGISSRKKSTKFTTEIIQKWRKATEKRSLSAFSLSENTSTF